MAYTLNRRLAQLVDSNGQLNTGKIPNDYITSDHVADNTITSAMLHTSFTVSTSNLTAIDTDDVSEGSTNLYYTDARVDARLLGNTITSNHGIVADNDGNKVELTTNGSIEITRTAGSPFIDFKDSTSEDYDQRIQVSSGNFNFTADGLSISGSEFIDSSRNIDIGSGTISSGAITSTGEVEATALDINGNGDISGNLTLGGYIAGPATFTIDPAAVGDNTGTVVIAGNLQVDGTTTTINSTTVNVDDLNIQLATGAANSAAANGAGITVDGAGATITYDGTNDEWDFNKDINVSGSITTGQSMSINNSQVGVIQQAHGITSGNTVANKFQVGRWKGVTFDKWMLVPVDDGTAQYSNEFGYNFSTSAWFFDSLVDFAGNIDVTGKITAGELDVGAGTSSASIFRTGSNGSGFHFTDAAIFPTDETGTITNGTEDLGGASNKFKDGYFGGAINTDTITTTGNVDVGGNINIENGYLKITNSGQGSGIELADINGNPQFIIVTDQQSPQNTAIVNNWGNSNNAGVLLGTSRSDGIALQVAKSITIDGTTGLPTNGGTRLFSVQGNGTVSINQPSPSSTYKLDVGGAIRSTGAAPSYTLREDDASNQTWLMGSYAGNYAIRDTTVSGTTYPFQIEPATPSSTVYLDSTGKVGIGTSTPQAILSVKKSLAQESADLRVLDLVIPGSWSNSGNAGHTADITWTNSTSAGTIMGKFGLRYAGTATGGQSEFVFKDMYQSGYGASNDIMYLGSNGYVSIPGRLGIGETSPDTTLHVKSDGATSIAIESTTNAQNLDLLFYNNAGSTQGYIRYAEGPGDFYFVPQNGGGASLKLDYTGFMTYGDEPSGDPPPNTASFRMNSSSTTGGPSTGGSTGGNTYYPVVIGGGTHLAGRAFGIGLDPEGYGYRNKIGIVVEGDGAGYSKGDLHFLFNNSSDGQNAQISDAKFTFLREGYLGIGTRSPQRKLHIIGADGSSGMTEGNSRCALFIDNSAATYVNIASGNTSNGAIFFSDVNANNRGAVRYEHLTDSMSFDRGGSETLRLSGQTNVAYTADGLFHSNARPHTWQCTTGGSFVLGYRDHGSGLYQGAMGLQYDNIDGLGNTAYRDAFVLKETSNGGQEHFRVSGNGNVTNTNNSYGQISDERLKTDIVDASSQWEDIKAVRVRKFKFGTAPEGHDFLQIGVISQELEAAGMNGLIEESDPDDAQLAFNPELVGQQVKTVKYSVLYMKAIKALQEAMNRIEQLETRVTELEG